MREGRKLQPEAGQFPHLSFQHHSRLSSAREHNPGLPHPPSRNQPVIQRGEKALYTVNKPPVQQDLKRYSKVGTDHLRVKTKTRSNQKHKRGVKYKDERKASLQPIKPTMHFSPWSPLCHGCRQQPPRSCVQPGSCMGFPKRPWSWAFPVDIHV